LTATACSRHIGTNNVSRSCMSVVARSCCYLAAPLLLLH
jgi:hypothetical protein